MLIFCIGRHFESHILSTRVTPHSVLRQVIDLGLEFGGGRSRVRVIRAIAYIQSLNASSEPKNRCIALEAMIRMNKTA